jgi:phage FluMu protein Com
MNKRECLRCDVKFKPVDRFNRLCPKCQMHNKHSSAGHFEAPAFVKPSTGFKRRSR